MFLDSVLVPCLSEKGKLGVYSAKEEEMQKPNVGDIVDIKPISDFEGSEMLSPGHTNLGSDVNPKYMTLYKLHDGPPFRPQHKDFLHHDPRASWMEHHTPEHH
ncbi:hypothetical protein B0H14DRAFT_2596379 [Mycena olivaceomarginata]|nr:hypothetical protein B0H14DRAFT_2596379 [Mycena olivaceomarginata]